MCVMVKSRADLRTPTRTARPAPSPGRRRSTSFNSSKGNRAGAVDINLLEERLGLDRDRERCERAPQLGLADAAVKPAAATAMSASAATDLSNRYLKSYMSLRNHISSSGASPSQSSSDQVPRGTAPVHAAC